MTKRYKLIDTVVMQLEGQTTVVLADSVIDVPDSMTIATRHATRLDPGETARALGSHNAPTPVRNVRKK